MILHKMIARLNGRNTTYKLTMVLLIMGLSLSTATVKATEPDEKNTDIRNPYIFNYFAIPDGMEKYEDMKDDYDPADKLELGNVTGKVNYSVVETKGFVNGLNVSGKMKNIEAESVSFIKNFDFGTGNPNRIGVDALVSAGDKVFMQVFLDDGDTPAVKLQLPNQSNEDSFAERKYTYVDIPSGTNFTSNKVRITFTNDSDGMADDKKVNILLRSIKFYKPSVPTVYVNIDESLGTINDMNNSKEHNVNCYGEMTVKVPAGYKSPYTDETYTGGTYPLEYIRGRGNSTWDATKKPYKIKLEEKEDLFGMGENKHWALIANYYDPTLIRNRITYYLGEAMGMEYTPKLIPVDVVMNDKYLGSYYLSEVIRVDETRVNIDDLEKADADTDITGGYLLGMSPYGKEAGLKFTTKKKNVQFVVESPEAVDGDETGELIGKMNSYIEDYINHLEEVIYSDDFKDEEGNRYTDYMDITSAARYFLMQSFTKNNDSYITPSTKLYKTRAKDGKEGKLYWGPVWDFDYVAWNYTVMPGENGEDLSYQNFEHSFEWFDRLLNDQEFVDEILKVWRGTDENDQSSMSYQLNELVKDGGIIDQYADELRESVEANYDKEGNYQYVLNADAKGHYLEDGTYIEDNISYSNLNDYLAVIELQKEWITKRIDWVEENIDNIADGAEKDPPVVNFYDGEELIGTRKAEGGDVSDYPEVQKEGYYFCGWYFIDPDSEDGEETIFDSSVYVSEDVDVYAKWISEDELIKTESIVLRETDIYLNIFEESKINYTILPKEANDYPVSIKSSDEASFFINPDGTFMPNNVGDFDVVITTIDGANATCHIHVGKEFDYMPASSIEVDKTTVELKEGDTERITISCQPEASKTPNLRMISSNPEIAVMDDAGIISAGKAGTAYIVILGDDVEDYKTVKVTVKGEDNKENTPEDKKEDGDKPGDDKEGNKDNNKEDASVENKTADTSKESTNTASQPDNAQSGTGTKKDSVSVIGKNKTFEIGKFRYKVIKQGSLKNGKVSGGTVQVTGYTGKAANKYKTLTINDKITYMNNTFKITSIKASAFKKCTKVKTINIGRNVTSIGKKAFYGCKNVKKIVIKGNRCTFAKNTFSGIQKNVTVKVPKKSRSRYVKLFKRAGINI